MSILLTAAVILLSICLPATGEEEQGRWGRGSLPLGRVKLQVMGPRSNLIQACEVASFRDRRGKEFASKFEHCEARNIPYGVYEGEVQAYLGFPTTHKRRMFVRLDIRDPFTSQTLDATYSSEVTFRGPEILSLRIDPAPDQPSWIKVVALYGDETRTLGVESNGSTTLTALPQGRYLAMIFVGHAEPVLRQFDHYHLKREITLTLNKP